MKAWHWLTIGAGAVGVLVLARKADRAATAIATSLSPNFSANEFASHDGAETPPEALSNLARLCHDVLEKLRAEWGGPLIIVSGYRSPAHNKAVDGAKESQHMLGKAADVRPLDLGRMKEFVTVCERHAAKNPAVGGLGIYPGWVQLDIRARVGGRLTRWVGK